MTTLFSRAFNINQILYFFVDFSAQEKLSEFKFQRKINNFLDFKKSILMSKLIIRYLKRGGSLIDCWCQQK